MRRPECVTVAQKYLSLDDWKAVRAAVNNEDILMIRSLSSRKRIGLELCKRLQTLTGDELGSLASCDDSATETSLCWIGICRTYEFIRDFLDDVVSVRWAEGLGNVTQGAYESFVEDATATHPELDSLAEGTRTRLRNQLFQMLREAGITDSKDDLVPYLVPFSLMGHIAHEERRFFPTATFVE